MFVAKNNAFLFVLFTLTLGSIAISIAFNILRHDQQQIHELLQATLMTPSNSSTSYGF